MAAMNPGATAPAPAPRARHVRQATLVCILHLALAGLVMWLVASSGTYPGGADSYAHLFEASSLLDSIRSGNPWPLAEPLWYNGAQLMRYVGPVFACALAACEALAGGVLGGFVLFCGLVYFVGALGWYAAGRRLGRPWLSVVLGALWFVLPANLTALFVEGDLSRCLCLALLPALLGALDAFLDEGGRARLAGVCALFAAIVLSSVAYAVLVGIGVVAFLLLHGLVGHGWARVAQALLACVLAYAACGLWLVPFVAGEGLASAVQVDAQGLGATLASGWLGGAEGGIHLGIAAAALVVLGLACSRRASLPAFLATALLVLLTARTAQPVVGALTDVCRAGSLGLVSVALALVLLALLRWKSLRRPVLIAVVALLALDAAPSWSLLYGAHNSASAEERLERHAADTLVSSAREVTVQRLALVDEGGLDAESAYLACGLDEPLAIAEGADARTAVAKNYEQLDRALEEGRFGYLFDRSLELGCDSVIVRTSLVQDQDENVATRIDGAAGQCGYALVDTSGDYRLYHRDVDGTFGIRSAYDAIAIGTGAGQIALQFPSVEEGGTSLDDYTAGELARYGVVYLDGFTYSSRQDAEELVRGLAASGTRVVIMADGMPEDEHTGETSFLGVSAQPITFHGGFPELSTRLGTLDCSLFPAGHEQWGTVYLNGLDDVWGSVDEDGRNLAFYGSVCGGNVVFVGLNLTYFEAVTGDAGVAALLADSLQLDQGALPERTLVPLSVEWRGNELSVTTDESGVGTAIAWRDDFAATEGASERCGLLNVDAGTTTLALSYPCAGVGAVVSAAGVAGLVALLSHPRRREAPKGA